MDKPKKIISLFDKPLPGVCPEGHIIFLYPPCERWVEALDRKMRGVEEPLPISEDECPECISKWLVH